MARKKRTTKKKTTKKAAAKPRPKRRSRAKRTSANQEVDAPLRPGMLVTFRRGAWKDGMAAISQAAGALSVSAASDYVAESPSDFDSQVLMLEKIGAAVIDLESEHAMSLYSAVSDDAILSVDPEPIFMACGQSALLDEDGRLTYLRGYRDAVNQVFDTLVGEQEAETPRTSVAAFQDSNSFTWGLHALGVDQSPLSGKGVRVAVLDTGMDLDHPDYVGRHLEHRSFIPGQSVEDLNGHGTHCVGTACGPRDPELGRGYGVAYGSDIYVGKVLSNQGSSLGRSTLLGIEWAVGEKVDIISLSLSGRVAMGQRPIPTFEHAGTAALENGTMIIAAAGNDSRRANGEIEPVGSPANCPSYLAVAAVDRFLDVADYSNGGLNPNGGQIDLAGPGSLVYSSAPEPAPPRQPPFFRQWESRYDTISGTSMATPHVTGVAALLKEANPNATPERIRQLLLENVRKLSAPSRDVGAGLVQAPRVSPPNGAASVRVIG